MSTAVTNAAAKSKGNLKDAGKPKIWYENFQNSLKFNLKCSTLFSYILTEKKFV